jgi:hypothetical protein
MTTTINAGAIGPFTLASGDNYTLESSGSITYAAGTALTLSGGDCVVSVFGGIYGVNGIVESNTGTGANSVYIGTEGIVSGVSGVGILLFDDNNFVTNDGVVQGNVYGVELEGDGEMVSNNGHIAGTNRGVALVGAQSAITNTGTITGGEGVVFNGASTVAADQLENSGTITANNSNSESADSIGVLDENHACNMIADNSGTITGSRGIIFEGASGLIDSLNNSGVIDGYGACAVEEEGGSPAGGAALAVLNSGTISCAADAIIFGAESLGNTLDNSGTILGNIVSDDSSTLAITNSGHIAGGIVFGDVDSSYDGTLGSVTGWVNGGAGNDSLAGGAGQDKFDGGSGTDTIDGNGGNDHIDMTSFFDPGDQIDGGSGRDVLSLNGDYSTIMVLGADTLTNVEKIVVATGFSYNFVTDDNTVAAGARLVVDASALTSTQKLSFNGSAETDGRFTITGGAGADVLTGGAGNDVFVGGLGKNVYDGGAGADHMTAGGNAEKFVYTDVSDSTSTVRDIITSFNVVNDQFDMDVTVAGIDTAVITGRLGAANFDTNLTAALSGHLLGGHAIVFAPTIGGLAGHTFLIVDANGVAGYQAGQDYVMELVGAGSLISLSTANFI